MSVLEVQHLSLSLGDRALLCDLCFRVDAGERVGIVGPNGAGKTTLLRLIAGQLSPDCGAVRVSAGSVGMLAQEADSDAASPLSGGERTRRALDRALEGAPALLLLDEPTNHLDLAGAASLVERLRRARGAVVVVSHDRYFLDRTVDRILELQDGRLTEYAGGYSDYRAEKQRLRQEQLHRYQEDQKRRRALEQDIADMRRRAETAHRKSTQAESSGLKMGEKEKKRARAKKMDKKVKSDVKRLERLLEHSETRPEKEREVYFRLEGTAAHGKRVLEARSLTKRFGGRTLFEDAAFTLCRGDRVALYGPNGAGKTTFLRMLTGEESYEDELWLSPAARPHLVRQDFADLESGALTVLEYLQQELGAVTGAHRTLLDNLGLTQRHMRQRVGSLSYGEKMKLKLAAPMLRQEDFLLLDEPTNHLDLPTREQLEEALAGYGGTLLVASHDVYLLRRLCTRVLYADGETLRLTAGGFSAFMEQELGL